jgi:hypothetical protein
MQRAFGLAINPLSALTIPNAVITVYNNGTLTPSTIYSDNISTPKANPFLADANGYWFFYAANGRYDVQINPGPGAVIYTFGDVDLNDTFTLNGLTASVQTMVVGTAGSDFNIVDTAPGIHTFNIPDAGPTQRGLVSTGAQQFAGVKGFLTPIAASSGGTGLAALPIDGQLLIGKTNFPFGFALSTLTGTANQIVVTNGSGTITLSTPQAIGTGSSPTFASITDSLLAANQFGLVYISDTLGTFAVLPPLTSGQILIGSTGVLPVATTLTAGANTTITNNAGSITIAAAAGINSLNGLTAAAAPSQSLAVGTAGSDFAIVSAGSSHTFNLPDAGAAIRGALTATAQTVGGLKTFNVPPQYQAGTSVSSPAILSGVINAQVSVAGVGNVGAGETTAFTFTLPANALSAAGKAVRLTLAGSAAANATSKTIKAYFGATNCAQAAALNNGNWIMQATFQYASNTTQVGFSMSTMGAVSAVNNVAPTETASGAIIVKGTLQGGVNNDLLATSWLVEILG